MMVRRNRSNRDKRGLSPCRAGGKAWCLFFMAQSFRTEFPSRVSLEERELVDSILGYHAHNLFSIAAKSSNGDPLVIQLYPLTDHSDAYKSKQRNSFEVIDKFFFSC